MRDRVSLFVNKHRYEIRGDAAFASLTDFLRQHCELTGTKVVCAEGDCGACTVLVGEPDGDGMRYQTVDACIQFLYQLDGRHVVTVEGLKRGQCDEELHPIQRAMVDCHGSQCGFCTPGFVMALAGRAELAARGQRTDPRLSLTGNLCRCTGYVSILDASAKAEAEGGPTIAHLYPTATIARELRESAAPALHLKTPTRQFFAPDSLATAVEFKSQTPDAVIVSGGTELGVIRNKLGIEPANLLSLTRIAELNELTTNDREAMIGANVTWTELEDWSRDALPEFYKIAIRFGSPQIRNVGTLVGNVVNGSPIADSLALLLVMDAELLLTGPGGVRQVKVADFYKGYKVKDLARDEIVTQIRLPLPERDDVLKCYKVSRRNDLDIATFGAAIRIRRAGEVISRASIAYSGVAATVVRLPKTEEFLKGKRFTQSVFAEAGTIARGEITPIDDVRGSRDFRWTLAETILSKFFAETSVGYTEAAI